MIENKEGKASLQSMKSEPNNNLFPVTATALVGHAYGMPMGQWWPAYPDGPCRLIKLEFFRDKGEKILRWMVLTSCSK